MTNYTVYNNSMCKSLNDKYSFWGGIDADIIVDYGCADGSLIKYIIDNTDHKSDYVGFDNNETMLMLAERNLKDKYTKNNIKLTSNWNEVKEACSINKTSILVLSSIIHEIYNYCSYEEIKKFWKDVFNSNFTYIVIRDMMFFDEQPFNKKVKITDLHNIKKNIELTKFGEKQLKDFEEIYGEIESKGDLVHFFSKYKYIENWEREVKENYYKHYTYELISDILAYSQYNIEYLQSFTLDYLRDWVSSEFNYKIDINTHVKMILKYNEA